MRRSLGAQFAVLLLMFGSCLALFALTPKPKPPSGGAPCVRWQGRPPAILGRQVRSVAVFGNGPLTEDDRAAAHALDVVMRCNKHTTMLEGERIDLLLTRLIASTCRDWGGLRDAATLPAQTAIIVAYEENPTCLLHAIAEAYPANALGSICCAPELSFPVPGGAWSFRETRFGPSTGWLAVYVALRLFPAAEVHVFGVSSTREGASCRSLGLDPHSDACRGDGGQEKEGPWGHNSAREVEMLSSGTIDRVTFHGSNAG